MEYVRRFLRDERGHVSSGPVLLLAIAGAVLLAWGILDSADGLVIAGVVVGALALLTSFFAVHRWVVEILGRLDELERKG